MSHPRYPCPPPDQALKDLLQSIAQMRTVDECERFFADLCTNHELESLVERWRIAKLIHIGIPYRVITKRIGASSATIARVAQSSRYGKGGLYAACKKRVDIPCR